MDGIEEDTQRPNLEDRKRGIIATSKVRAAITIANIPPGDVSFLPSSLFSKVTRLSKLGNLSWIANSLVEDTTA